jgi:hypothetical protein
MLWRLAWTSSLHRLGGREAVARATREVIAYSPAIDADAPGYQSALWRTYRALERAKRLWPRPVRCLQSALVLHAALRRRGIDATLRLGARWDAGELEAHAWVEVGPYVLDSGNMWESFQRLDSGSPELKANVG